MRRMLVVLSAALAAIAGLIGVTSAASAATKPPLKITVSPTSTTAGSTGNSFTFKVTATSSASGQLSIVVPAGWSAPQASNSTLPGYVVIQKLTCASAGPFPSSITGTGPWTVYISFSCGLKKTFSLTYSKVTAPATAIAYEFTTMAKIGSAAWQRLSIQPVVTVSPPPVHLSVTGLPGTATAGTANSFTVTALDPANNVVTGYTGTVHFTSTDASATLPANYTFTASDAGVHTFSPGATFATAGSQTLTATDTANSATTGSQTVTVAAQAATHFAVTGMPPTDVAGTPTSFIVTALDSSNNVVTGYRGTVHFTSTDGSATLPADYTFTASDAGVHTFSPGATFTTAGSQTVTGTDTATSISGSQSTNVLAAAATHLVVKGLPDPFPAGSLQTVTVTAKDAFGNTATSYTGTIHFTSTDSQAILPNDYTFTALDAGTRTFNVALTKAGSQAVTATDTLNSSINGSQSVTVAAGPATHLVLSGLSDPSAAGVPQTVTVTATDPFGNVATRYTGTVHFSSTDGLAVLPPDHTFTAADAGSANFTVTLGTNGTQTLTATDAANSLTDSRTVTVTGGVGPVTHFAITGLPGTATAGSQQTITVVAEDASNKVVTDYTGKVHFTSTDGFASLPTDFTFTAGDAGMASFNVTLKTAGPQTVFVTDTSNSAVTGSDSTAVTPGPAVSFVVSGLAAPSVAGAQQTATITAVDPFGNTATSYTGTVTLSSTDPHAVLAANFAFTAGDMGTASAGVTLETAGPQTVTVTDTTVSSITGSQTVTVQPGPLASLAVSPSNATVEAPSPEHFSPNMDTYEGQTGQLPGFAVYSAEGFDAFGNDIGNMTQTAQWSGIGGTCIGSTCSADSLGQHSVQATVGTVFGSAGLVGAYTGQGYSCEGDNYDVNGNPSDGCEVPQPLAAHTQSTASPVGSVSCVDSPLTTITGVLPSDSRVHQLPPVNGFDSNTGSAPEWYSVNATGGTFCPDDYNVNFQVGGSAFPNCYKVTMITNAVIVSAQTDLAGSASMSGGAGSYTDGSTIYFEVQKICSVATAPADNPSFSINFSL